MSNKLFKFTSKDGDIKLTLNDDKLKNKEVIERDNKITKGQNSFREYCNAMHPEFFKSTRKFQDIVCDTMQKIYEKKLINPSTKEPYSILVINLPPGHGKSFTASNFATWLFGKSTKNQIITASYNQTLSSRFSQTVRDLIQDEEIEGDNNYFVVNSFFPKVKIKRGDGRKDMWSLEGGYLSYLATSFDGSITGMRGNIGIIDDPIKNAVEAVNDRIKEEHWDWYKNTFTSRILEGGIQVIIQTRWATDDLAGRIINTFTDKVYVLEMPVENENGEPLCDEILSKKGIADKKEALDAEIYEANYMQKPVDVKGALYKDFKTYSRDEIDIEGFERVIAYIDTADTGADYLCCIIAGVIGEYAYILDIYYTDKPMEITEKETTRRLDVYKAREVIVESNNGGRGFARNVEIRLKKMGNRRCRINWFHQSLNKKARILSRASNVQEQIIMPENYKKKYPEFFRDISKYQRKGKNEHDDAPDTITGIIEVVNGEIAKKKKTYIGKRSWFGV